MLKDQFVFTSKHACREFAADFCCVPSDKKQGIVIFIHGFKCFKDWGPFDLMAESMAEKGLGFLKVNMSHNGVTIDKPDGLSDMDSFSKNNLSVELDDIGVVIDAIHQGEGYPWSDYVDPERIFLLGHSRGGSLVLLKAAEETRVKGVVSWAPVSDFEKLWTLVDFEVWADLGVLYVWDQELEKGLPLHYQIVQDYFANKERLSLPKAIKSLEKPIYLVHAEDDLVVPVSNSKEILSWNQHASGLFLKEGGHSFGAIHPWESSQLPDSMQSAVEHSAQFFLQLCK